MATKKKPLAKSKAKPHVVDYDETESQYDELAGPYIPSTRRGRPKKEILGEIERIEKMAAIGLKVEQMSALLDISKRTFERRIKEEKKLSDALARGRALATEDIANVAYSMARYNYKMTQFWLRTQAGWKETMGIDHSSTGLDQLTDEEKKLRIQKIIDRLKKPEDPK